LTNKLTDILIPALVNDFAAEFEIFVLSTLEYQQFFHVDPWSATYDPTKNLTSALFSRQNVKSFRKVNPLLE